MWAGLILTGFTAIIVGSYLLVAWGNGSQAGMLAVVCAALANLLVSIVLIRRGIARERLVHSAALAETRTETVSLLSRAVGFRDVETGRHIDQISAYVELICRNLDCEDHFAQLVRQASPMHDVGKIGIPDTILLKPGPLSEQERREMQMHTILGHDLLAGTGNEILDMAASVALSHHERYDGKGYPNGLSGDDIPLEGRIVAVADVFDALVSDRIYRPSLSVEMALSAIVEGSGTHFDPRVASAFLSDVGEIYRIHGSAFHPVDPMSPAHLTPVQTQPAAAWHRRRIKQPAL